MMSIPIISSLSPLWQNIFVSLLTVLYVKLALDIGGIIQRRQGLGSNTKSRKFIHVCAACWILFWPLFNRTHWTWRLNVIVPSAMALKLFYKGAILRDPNDHDVQTMSRFSSPSDLLFGPLFFCLIMIYIGLYLFLTHQSAIVMAAVGIGDGIAPVIGSVYGRHHYRMPMGNVKTVEGSLTVFLGTIVGCYFFFYGLGLDRLPLKNILIYGGVASLIEGCSPGAFDNLTIAAGMLFTYERLKPFMFF